jgi:hypothetical protein
MKHQRKRAGGRLSGPDEIAEALSEMGYQSREVRAICESRTPQSAAERILAKEQDRRLSGVRASVSRGRRLLIQHAESGSANVARNWLPIPVADRQPTIE